MPVNPWSWPPMPHKHNDDGRHHIPKMAFKVRNWPEYEAGLRRRGSLCPATIILSGVLPHPEMLPNEPGIASPECSRERDRMSI